MLASAIRVQALGDRRDADAGAEELAVRVANPRNVARDGGAGADDGQGRVAQERQNSAATLPRGVLKLVFAHFADTAGIHLILSSLSFLAPSS